MVAFDRLSRNQRRAIAALLTSKTIAEAAIKAGLGENTLYRYLRDDDFSLALRQAEGRAVNTAARRLIARGNDALDVLETLMHEAESESVRRLAASHWVDSVLRWAEKVAFENRIAALEESLHEKS